MSWICQRDQYIAEREVNYSAHEVSVVTLKDITGESEIGDE